MTFDTVSMKIQHPESSPISHDSSIKCPNGIRTIYSRIHHFKSMENKLTILIFRLIPYHSKAETRSTHIPPIDDN